MNCRPAMVSAQIPADIVSPVSQEDWRAIYDADPEAMPSHSVGWTTGLVETGLYRDVSRLYLFADGTRAVLPLFAARGTLGLLSGKWSPPTGWGYGGTISSAPLTSAHIATILSDLAVSPPLRMHLRPSPLQSDKWNEAAGPEWTRLSRTGHILDLSGGFEQVWKERFRPRTRTTIRKAERAGLEISSGSDAGLVNEFYGLLTLSFGRWAKHDGRPVNLARWRGRIRDPIDRFQKMVQMPGSLCRVWVARHHGEPAAAILVLQDRNAHYTRGAMNEQTAGPTSAAYLLHRLAIEEACKVGCRLYHMGDTGPRSSLAQFKTRFGAVEIPYTEFRLERLPFSWLEKTARRIVTHALGSHHA